MRLSSIRGQKVSQAYLGATLVHSSSEQTLTYVSLQGGFTRFSRPSHLPLTFPSFDPGRGNQECPPGQLLGTEQSAGVNMFYYSFVLALFVCCFSKLKLTVTQAGIRTQSNPPASISSVLGSHVFITILGYDLIKSNSRDLCQKAGWDLMGNEVKLSTYKYPKPLSTIHTY